MFVRFTFISQDAGMVTGDGMVSRHLTLCTAHRVIWDFLNWSIKFRDSSFHYLD